jgi:DNA replication protein DnaC
VRCPYDVCDGSGWIVDDRTRTATACRCHGEQRARRVAGGLRARIAKKYRDLGFDRPPVSLMDRRVVGIARDYVAHLDERLAAGEGLWLTGGTGNGKTSLATLVSKHAIEAGRTVAIYSLPRLLAEIRDTFDNDSGLSMLQLHDALTRVDLLQIDDVGAEQSTPWVLEQLYSIVNARYEEERAVMITTNLDPDALREQVGERTVSRLEEMCRIVMIPDAVDHRHRQPTDGGPGGRPARDRWGAEAAGLGVAGHEIPGGAGALIPGDPGALLPSEGERWDRGWDDDAPPPVIPPTWGTDPQGAHRPVRRGRDQG